MKIFIYFIFLCLSQKYGPPVEIDNVPFAISKCLQNTTNNLEISRRMNPFYLRGDFDGDGKIDYVVLVRERKSNKQGYAFCFAGNNRKLQIAGAGTAIALADGIRDDDLTGLDVWGVAESWSTNPKMDALYLARAESGSGILYWDGTQMVWKQRGI